MGIVKARASLEQCAFLTALRAVACCRGDATVRFSGALFFVYTRNITSVVI